MHRLFWKLFFGYWLALFAFSALALFSVSHYLEQVRTRHEANTPHADFLVHLHAAQRAAAVGRDALADWARRVDERELAPWLVLDAQGRDLLGREVSPRLLAHLAGEGRPRDFGPRDAGPPPWRPGEAAPPPPPWASPQLTVDGAPYRLVPDYRNVSLARLLTRPRVLALPIALAALVGGLLSLVLARYLAAPVERLKRATQAWSAGDFSQRVGPTLGRRRDEIVDLAHALDDMAGHLDVLLRAQRDLLRDVSHELRSPLARLQAALGLAQQGSDAAAALLRIERETERLGDLISAILSFSRLESGVQPRASESVDLRELLAGLALDAELEGAARGVSVALTGAASAPVVGDPVLLHSALENIVRNALRHSPDGGVVEIDLGREASGAVRVTLRDHGPGVPEAQLGRIFEPFVRLDDARTTSGAGLGLSIARHAVQAHGGSLAASNAEGGGLCVSVVLPVGPVPASPPS